MSKSTILVTGGAGNLGGQIVTRLREAGRDVRVMSRSKKTLRADVELVVADLEKDEGVDAAVAGIHTIVNCAGTAKGDPDKARNLMRAASVAGVQHVVHISVVGADRLPVVSRVDRAMFGYFESKLGAERVVAEAGIPWTTLRATQFHDLLLLVAEGMSKLPVIPMPTGARFQPVDSGEVADRMVELALGEPAGLVPDIAGPRVYGFAELVRSYLRASGKHRLMVPIWLPGRAARAYRAGANLPLGGTLGRRTWEDFLSDRLAGARGGGSSVPEPGR